MQKKSSRLNKSLSDISSPTQSKHETQLLQHKKMPIGDMFKLVIGERQGLEATRKHQRPPAWKISKEQHKSYIDQVRNKAMQVPDPQKYEIKIQWEKSLGKFSNMNKQTYLNSTLKRVKTMPGPASYDPKKPQERILMGKIAQAERSTFMSTAEYYSHQTPSVADHTPKIVKLNPPSLKMVLPKVIPNINIRKSPGPGQYEKQQTAYLKFMTPNNRRPIIGKAQNISFSQQQAKKRQTPGVGAYDPVNLNKLHRVTNKTFWL